MSFSEGKLLTGELLWNNKSHFFLKSNYRFKFPLCSLACVLKKGRRFFIITKGERSNGYAVLRLKYEETSLYVVLLSRHCLKLISVQASKCDMRSYYQIYLLPAGCRLSVWYFDVLIVKALSKLEISRHVGNQDIPLEINQSDKSGRHINATQTSELELETLSPIRVPTRVCQHWLGCISSDARPRYLLTLYTSKFSMMESKQVYKSFSRSTTCKGVLWADNAVKPTISLK